MITVLLTCLVLAGSTFVPPKDWTIEKIQAPHSDSGIVYPCNGCDLGEPSRAVTRVYLKRQIKVGETINPPNCEVSLKAEHDEEHSGNITFDYQQGMMIYPSEITPQ